MRSHIMCSGCRNLLLYPRGASNVCCALCNTITPVLPPDSSQMSHIHCGNCRTTLMYPYGAPSVKCAICHYITNVCMTNGRPPVPAQRPNETTGSGTSRPRFESQTVVVENPMSVDSSGKLVSNVVVGVTTEKK